MVTTNSVGVLVAMVMLGTAGETVRGGGFDIPGWPGFVPEPLKVEARAGAFSLTPECKIYFQESPKGAQETAEYLAPMLRKAFPRSARDA
jgi:hypothetical protein